MHRNVAALRKAMPCANTRALELGRIQKRDRWVLVASSALLGLTTVWWSSLAARIHMGNADQLANSYLFDNLRDAVFPGSHSFLMKFPLFLCNYMFGPTATSLIVTTVLVSLVTVGLFAYILSRIEKRPIPLAMLLLAMSSVLLFVPIEPRAGAMLPVNMAMLATRNLEYILYITGLYFVLKASTWQQPVFYLGGLCLTLLFASDKLFLALTVGAALILMVISAIFRHREALKRSVRLVVASLAAWLVGTGILMGLSALHVVSIEQSSIVTPYALGGGLKGLAYGLVHILTNLGANPLYDKGFDQISPAILMARLTTLQGIGYIINGLVIIGGCVATAMILRRWHQNRTLPLAMAPLMSVMLITSTVAALVVFSLTDHFYVVDARYLGISFFALFFCLATGFSQWTNYPRRLPLIVLLLACTAIISGCYNIYTQYDATKHIQRPYDVRNTFVANALAQSQVGVLVGDYWRVYPIKSQPGANNVQVVPLANCVDRRKVLANTSTVDLKTQAFAYLFTSDSSPTGFPTCSPETIMSTYGIPNRSIVVAGTADEPTEMLLMYDFGINNQDLGDSNDPAPGEADQTLNTIFEVLSAEKVACDARTIMTIVAHQDDDLLFMSPDMLHNIDAKDCMRTVYLTAGDAAQESAYWIGRQRGAEAAYATMAKVKNEWEEQRIKLLDGIYASVTTLKAAPRISLLFFNLPDGSPSGQGFAQRRHESLMKLEQKRMPTIHSVDNLSVMSRESLIESLNRLMSLYAPSEIRTHSDVTGTGDHTDHIYTGIFTRLAFGAYKQNDPEVNIHYYKGYPVQKSPTNVSGDDLSRKKAVFYAYGKYDSAVCTTDERCKKTAYSQYLPRQYQAQ